MSFYRNFFKVVEEINERNTFEINSLLVFKKQEKQIQILARNEESISCVIVEPKVEVRTNQTASQLLQSYYQANAPPITT